MAKIRGITEILCLVKQKSLANAKGNARDRCMFEGPLQTNLSSSILAMDIGYDVFTFARWRHCLAWLLPFEWPNVSLLNRVFKFDTPYEKFLECRGAKFE